MVLDHVILAAADLDAAARRFEEEHGLAVQPGGRHEGLGTHNRIVPVGGGYLEIMALADPDEAAGSELGRILARRIEEASGGLMAWCVAVDDVEAVAARLGTELHRIGREGLTATLTGVAEAMAEPTLPFFIERDRGVADPGASGDAGGIEWVEVRGSGERLKEWLGGAELPLRVADGPPELRAVGVGGRSIR